MTTWTFDNLAAVIGNLAYVTEEPVEISIRVSHPHLSGDDTVTFTFEPLLCWPRPLNEAIAKKRISTMVAAHTYRITQYGTKKIDEDFDANCEKYASLLGGDEDNEPGRRPKE